MSHAAGSQLLSRREDGTYTSVPLKSVDCSVTILDFFGQVCLSQTYQNDSDVTIEATYQFPLEIGAAITSVVIENEGKQICAKLEEVAQAKATYEEAIYQGHGAYLLEENAQMPDVFTMSVGNMLPGATAVIKVTYVTQLTLDDTSDASGSNKHRLRFILPMSISPRYFPAPYSANEAPRYTEKVDYRMECVVTARLSSAILAVESPSHPLSGDRMILDDNTATIQLANEPLVGDVVLLFTQSVPHKARAWVTPSSTATGERVIATALYPDLANTDFDGDVNGEFIFVVDRSGSMSSGNRIGSAREALIVCLASLPMGAHFNVWSFGNSFSTLFEESAVFNNETKAQATNHAKTMEADMGGTEMLGLLTKLGAIPPSPNKPRQVFVITDGAVANSRQVIDCIRAQNMRWGTRFFAFGVGSGVSTALVNGIAKAGGGVAEFVADGEGVQSKVLRQLGRALLPSLTNTKVMFDDAVRVVRSSPCAPLPIFDGTRQLLFSEVVMPEGGAVPETVMVSMEGPDGEFITAVPVLEANAQEAELLRAAAAQCMLRDIEDEVDNNKVANNQNARSEEDCKKDAVALSISTGVKCRWTSYVAVELRDRGSDPAPDSLVVVKVPITYGPATAPSSGIYEQCDLLGMAVPALASAQFMCCSAPAPQYRGGGGAPMFAAERRAPSRQYCDNPANRTVGRVGAPAGAFTLRASSLASAVSSAFSFGGKAKSASAAPPRSAQQEMKSSTLSAPTPTSDPFGMSAECCAMPPPPPMPGACVVPPSFSAPAPPARKSKREASGNPNPNGTATAESTLSDIMSLQNADGSWSHTIPAVLDWLKLPALPANASAAEFQYPAVYVTLLVLAALHERFGAQQELWELPAKKARKWVKKILGREVDNAELAKLLADATAAK